MRKNKLIFFNSFEDMENHSLNEMVKLSGIEILQQIRQMINTAYGMHGYNPNNLPQKHKTTNIKYVE